MTDIITTKKRMKDGGYTGLFYPGECACGIEDLAPCGYGPAGCEMGYKFSLPGDEFDFIVKKDNVPPSPAEYRKCFQRRLLK